MEVLIENYRGVDVIFNTESQRFSFKFDEGEYHQKQSYSACKSNIDKYMKDNQDFEPIVLRDSSDWTKKFSIVGLRKDKRFIQEINGEKSQYSDYTYFTNRIYMESDNSIYKRADDVSRQIKVLELKKRSILDELESPLFDKEYRNKIKAKYGKA